MKSLTLVFIALITPSFLFAADEWPQFRGPDGQGHTAATGLPTNWSETENVAWKTAIPGEGHSSPVISNNQIWLTTSVAKKLSKEEEEAALAKIANPYGLNLSGEMTLFAVLVNRTTGKLQKQIPLFQVPVPEAKHSLNSYASPTPVIAGDHVYFHFGTYGTACVARQSGDIVWKNDSVHVDHQNGPGSSPVVWNNLLIVHFDGMDVQFIAAFDRMTGDVVWKKKRSGEMHETPAFRKAYGTPLIVDVDGRPVLISPAANWLYGYAPEDGTEIWKAAYGKLGFSTVPRPVVANGMVYVSTSFLQPRMLAVRYDGKGDVTDSHVEWISDQRAPKQPSLLVVEDRLYSVTDNGIASCMNAMDGSELGKMRLPGDYSASPLYAEGRVYFFGRNGQATVIEEGAEMKLLSRNRLEDGFMASPAIADSAMFLRTTTSLYRIESL